MNKTKTIYFLSAIVLIIGCYALNLSYSLFVQTEEHELISTTIPSLSYSLETSTYTILANSGKLIKLKIINSGSSDINYGISTTQIDGITVQLIDKEDNNIIGTLDHTTNKEVWVYVTNNTETDTEVLFTLTGKYTTVNFDENFIDNSNIDCVNTVKLLKETIIASAKDAVNNNDANRTLYNDTFDLNNITGISIESDRMLALAEDDYGTSYVYRGNVIDNYVNFAGFTWRIVRINGDGTIRLILDGTLDKVIREGEDNYAGAASEFNILDGDNAYVGYMYGKAGISTNANRCLMLVSGQVVDKIDENNTKELCEFNGGKWTTTAYEATHANVASSTIKTNLDTFYEIYIENEINNYHYEKYLADSIICGDKSLSNDGIGGVNKQLGYSNEETYYVAFERVYSSDGTSSINAVSPTLKCAEGVTNDYSRYTKDVQIINGIKTNGDLKYPIGLLTGDELLMAGAFALEPNNTYYLYDAYKKGLSNGYWWTLSPSGFVERYAYILGSADDGSIYNLANDIYSIFSIGARPLINLKADLLVSNGDGTKETVTDTSGNIISGPYTIK